MTYWEPDTDETNWDWGTNQTPTRTQTDCQHTQWVAIKQTNDLQCRYCHTKHPLPTTWHRNNHKRLDLQPTLTRYTTPPLAPTPAPTPGLSSGTGYIRGKTV